MSIAKVVEVNSSSNKSFEDAIQTGIAKVTETVKNVQGELDQRAESSDQRQ
jgi:flavin-binding protein dodecin